MNYRDVGNTGIRLSEIGFGCGGNAGLMVKGTLEQQREAIQTALESGVNYFDEAPDYGDGVSETNLGQALKDLGVRPYITTKVEVRVDDLDDMLQRLLSRDTDRELKDMAVLAWLVTDNSGTELRMPLAADDRQRIRAALAEKWPRLSLDQQAWLVAVMPMSGDLGEFQELIEKTFDV